MEMNPHRDKHFANKGQGKNIFTVQAQMGGSSSCTHHDLLPTLIYPSNKQKGVLVQNDARQRSHHAMQCQMCI